MNVGALVFFTECLCQLVLTDQIPSALAFGLPSSFNASVAHYISATPGLQALAAGEHPTWGQCYKTFFARNIGIFVVSYSVCTGKLCSLN